MDNVWISVAIVAIIVTVVQSLKGFFQAKWAVWVLNLIHLGVLVPYIPIILNVLMTIAAGLALYGPEGLTGTEIWSIVLMIIGADGAFKLVRKASGTEVK